MSLILNFHGIGSPDRPYEAGEEPYWISEEQFTSFLDFAQSASTPIKITFDDGNGSDFSIAVPELRQRGIKATFFVLAGKLDQAGYLSSCQAVEIDTDPLFLIGSHGMDHQPWPELSQDELLRETAHSQQILSQLCGRPITEVGLPFGRYDRRTLKRLIEQGYKTIYSSDGSPRFTSDNPIPRFSPRKTTSLSDLRTLVRNGDSVASRLKREAILRVKALR